LKRSAVGDTEDNRKCRREIASTRDLLRELSTSPENSLGPMIREIGGSPAAPFGKTASGSGMARIVPWLATSFTRSYYRHREYGDELRVTVDRDIVLWRSSTAGYRRLGEYGSIVLETKSDVAERDRLGELSFIDTFCVPTSVSKKKRAQVLAGEYASGTKRD
jgi:hypothetical protein